MIDFAVQAPLKDRIHSMKNNENKAEQCRKFTFCVLFTK